MSTTTMYVVNKDGSLSEFAEYRNSHGSAPQVWSHLSAKYVPDVAAPGERWSPDRKQWMTHDSVLGDMYAIANGGGMEEWERRTAWVCADYVICRPEDFSCYADALDRFAQEYGPKCEGQAFHIGEMAKDLRRVSSECPDARGVCWQMTSVGDIWNSGEMTKERGEMMMRDALAGLGLADAQLDAVISALDGWTNEDEWIPYNIDLDVMHSWLPGSEQKDWGGE